MKVEVPYVVTLEWLARELKSLIGYGAKPKHLILRPTLRDLVLGKYPVELRDLGVVIRQEIEEALGELPDKAEALRWLLNLYDKEMSALQRRMEAIYCLGGCYSVEAWRRPDGPELPLCRELAKVLMERLS